MPFSLLGDGEFELRPEYDSAKSFYGKARVTFMGDGSGAGVTLTSYETPIVTLYLTSNTGLSRVHPPLRRVVN